MPTTPLDLNDLITRGTAAQILGVVPATVTMWTYLGRLQAVVRLPGGWRLYQRQDVERIARERQQARPPAA